MSLAVPAGAWQLGEGAGIEARRDELTKTWRSYNRTMVDNYMVKHVAQEEEPDWVKREKEKMTPPDRPFGRLAGFTLRRDTVRHLMVGRHGPLTEGLKKSEAQKQRLAALRQAEDAAVAKLWASLNKTPGEKLELAAMPPGRDAFASRAEGELVVVTWVPLDWYYDEGPNAELYVLLYADKPRGPKPEPLPAVKRGPGVRFGGR